MFVLDASIARSWLFPDEEQIESEALLTALRRERAIVPGHFHVETGDALLTGRRRGRMSADQFERARILIADLPVDVDPVGPAAALDTALEIAWQASLTLYDAAYLELALRKKLPLATRDRDLRSAARALGVETLGAFGD